MLRERAQTLLCDSRTVVLDTETTGFYKTDQVIEIALMSVQGTLLLHHVVQATVPIHPKASAVHGWTSARLVGRPHFPEIYASLAALLQGRRVLAYIAWFDRRLLAQTCGAFDLPMLESEEWIDLAGMYQRYEGAPRLLPLPNATHGTVGDCRAALEVLCRIAGAQVAAVPLASTPAIRAKPDGVPAAVAAIKPLAPMSPPPAVPTPEASQPATQTPPAQTPQESSRPAPASLAPNDSSRSSEPSGARLSTVGSQSRGRG